MPFRVQPFTRVAIVLLCASPLMAGCSHDTDGPTAPSPNTIVVASPLRSSGGTIVVPVGTPPGAFFPRGGTFGATVSVTTNQDLPFAQLSVFLLTSDGTNYCGQNLPDSPTWRPFPKVQTITYTVTGFQVFRLPCEVTGIRVMFHTRDDAHLGGMPPASFTVAETTMPVVYELRQ